MTTRCNPITRAVALLILALALCSIPSALRAQVVPCACDHYVIKVDAGVACSVTICYGLTPSADQLICTTIPPGRSAKIPCPIDRGLLRLCDGTNYVLIDNNPVISLCTPILKIAPGCCVRACRGRDDAGCTVITFTAAPCASPACP